MTTLTEPYAASAPSRSRSSSPTPHGATIHVGPVHALEALQLLGGGAFLPVHWGTFSLAMHAWDEPAETLLSLAPQQGVQLVMPRLGEPVEPSQVDTVAPWWRGAADQPAASVAEPVPQAQATALADALPKGMPWPID